MLSDMLWHDFQRSLSQLELEAEFSSYLDITFVSVTILLKSIGHFSILLIYSQHVESCPVKILLRSEGGKEE